MSWQTALITMCAVLCAFGIGCYVGERDKKRKPLVRPYHDPRDFMARWTNYWRV